MGKPRNRDTRGRGMQRSAGSKTRTGMYTLYSMQRSGNCYKVRLAFAKLGIPYRLVEVDILKGETRTPEFLAKNPSGHVPLLEVAPRRYLAESNAILWYVAGGSPLAPEDRIDRAEAMQWMFFEQHSLEPNLGAARFWLTTVKGGPELQRHALEDRMERAYQALGVMEKHLAAVAQRKDRAALARMVVSKGFFWERDDGQGADPKKSSINNLAAAFNLEDADSPGWDGLAQAASDPHAAPDPQKKGVACAPAVPDLDGKAFETLAQQTKTDPSEWGFTYTAEIEVRAEPKVDAP